MAARFLCLAFQVTAFGADQFAGPGRERGERDAVILVGLLDAGDLEIFENHLLEDCGRMWRCPRSAYRSTRRSRRR